MYVLQYRYNGHDYNVMVSKYKKTIVKLLKERGYYYSTIHEGYIDDKTRRKKYGRNFKQGSLFYIRHIELLQEGKLSDASFVGFKSE